MLEILQVVIGIIFVILLFSLLASTVLEFIAGFLSLRGKNMVKTIRNMIGPELADLMTKHPFFVQLATGSGEKAKVGRSLRKLPSYINSGTFASVFMDIVELDDTDQIKAKIDAMPDSNVKKILKFLLKQSGNDVVLFKAKVEGWFNEVMERASGAYKRHTHRWLFLIGIAIAMIFNADIINVYHNLSASSTVREVVANAAGNYIANNSAPVTPNLDDANMDSARAEMKKLVTENISTLASPLGLGWEAVDTSKIDVKWWIYKLMGWFTMALAISFGATFWFDVLKKIINIRAAGTPPPAPQNTDSKK